MKKIIISCLIPVFMAATAMPAQAFWVETHPQLRGAWLIHCKNREDYPLRGDRGDALEFARSLCNELVAVEEHGVGYRASILPR